MGAELAYTADEEAELVRRAQAGDTEAFAALVALHQQFVYNLAWRVTGDAYEAEDLAQEAFVRAWVALPRFRGEARWRTWLYRIVTNVCYNRLPHLRRELLALDVETVDTMPEQCSPDPSDALEAGERRAYLHREIEALPGGYRLLVMLRFLQDLSYEEIAKVTGLPLGTVKTGLFRARARLRAALRRLQEEGDYERVA